MYSSYKEAKAARPWFKKKRFWLLAIIVVIIIAAVAGGGGSSEPTETNSDGTPVVTTPKAADVEITRAEYDQIKEGMTYDEVVAIVGGPGEESSTSDIGGMSSASYTWKGGVTDFCLVTFIDGKMSSKTQSGLG